MHRDCTYTSGEMHSPQPACFVLYGRSSTSKNNLLHRDKIRRGYPFFVRRVLRDTTCSFLSVRRIQRVRMHGVRLIEKESELNSKEF